MSAFCPCFPAWHVGGQALDRQPGALTRHPGEFVYADRFTRTETDADGNGVEREIPFLKAYTVFNVAQIEGLPAHYYARPEAKADKLELIESAEGFCAATGAVICHGGNLAYYAPGPDLIQLPPPEAFRDAKSYAATKAHLGRAPQRPASTWLLHEGVQHLCSDVSGQPSRVGCRVV